MSTSDAYPWDEHRDSGDRPPIWKAVNEGDEIIGTITEIWTFSKGEQHTPVLNLDTADGTASVWASQVLLRQALADQDPQVGDRIKIMFVGLKPTASGNTMKEFDVQVRKGAAPKSVEEPPPPVEDDPNQEPF